MHKLYKILAVFVLALVALGLGGEVGNAQTGSIECSLTEEQSDFYVDSVNAWRVYNGLNSLIVAPTLNGAALTHSQFIAEEHALIHGTRDQLWQGAVNGAYFVGENLGMGHVVHPSGTESIFNALVKSPGHNENMLNPEFDYIGVGTCTRGNYQYTTHRFMASWIINPSPPNPTPTPTPAAIPEPTVTAEPAVTSTATPTPTVTQVPTEPEFGLVVPKFVG